MGMGMLFNNELLDYRDFYCGSGSEKCIGPKCAKWRTATIKGKRDEIREVRKYFNPKDYHAPKSVDVWNPEYPDKTNDWTETGRTECELPNQLIEYKCVWEAKGVEYTREGGYCGEAGYPKKKIVDLGYEKSQEIITEGMVKAHGE